MTVVDIVGVEQFDTHIASSDKLVFVDFWASRCGPCRMLWPVLHDLAEKYPDSIEVLKINVDESANSDLAIRFQVRSIPQVTLFKNGQSVDQFIGALPADQIEQYITKYSPSH